MKFLRIGTPACLSPEAEGAGGAGSGPGTNPALAPEVRGDAVPDDEPAEPGGGGEAGHADEGEDEDILKRPDQPDPAVEPLEEIDYEGARYRVPKALKDAFLRHADYTRKTQEIAETRRALEHRQQLLVREAQEREADFEDRVRLAQMDEALEQYRNVDWAALRSQDPARAQGMFQDFVMLNDARQDLAGGLSAKALQRALQAERDLATRLQQSQAVLQREIKGWGPELQDRLREFGESHGYSRAELAAVEDPRAVRILHLAWLGQQLLSKQIDAARSAARPEAVPVPQVGKGRAPAARDPDRMGIEDWMRHRNAHIRKQR